MSKLEQIQNSTLNAELSKYRGQYQEIYPYERLVATMLHGYLPGQAETLAQAYAHLVKTDVSEVMPKIRYVLEYLLLQERKQLGTSAVLRILSDTEHYTIIRGSLPAYKDKLSLLLLSNIDKRQDTPEIATQIIESALKLKMDRPQRFALAVYAIANIGVNAAKQYERIAQVIDFRDMKDEHRTNLAYYFSESDTALSSLIKSDAKDVLTNIYMHLSYKQYQSKFDTLASQAYLAKGEHDKPSAFWIGLDYLSVKKYEGRYLESQRPVDTYEIIQRLQQFENLNTRQYRFMVSNMVPYEYSHSTSSSILDLCVIAKDTSVKNGVHTMNQRINRRVASEERFNPTVIDTVADLFGRAGLLVYAFNKKFTSAHWPTLVNKIVNHQDFKKWAEMEGFDHFCGVVHKLLTKPAQDFDISGLTDKCLDALNINHVVYNLNISLGTSPREALIATAAEVSAGKNIIDSFEIPEL